MTTHTVHHGTTEGTDVVPVSNRIKPSLYFDQYYPGGVMRQLLDKIDGNYDPDWRDKLAEPVLGPVVTPLP